MGRVRSKLFKILFSTLLFILTLYFAQKLFLQMSGGDFGQVSALYSQISLSYWILIAALALVFYLLDWYRYTTLLNLFHHKMTPFTGFQLTSVSYLVSSLTPVAELHLPTMVYLLKKRGIPTTDAISCTVAKGIYLTFWICVVSLVSLLLDRDLTLPNWLHTSFPALVAPFFGLCLLLSALVFFPTQIHTWIEAQSKKLKDTSLLKKILKGIDGVSQNIAKIGRSKHHSHLLAHLSALAFILTYILVGYAFAHALNLPISFPRAVTVFSTSLLIAYLSPVPGSIGITELATSYMLDSQLTFVGMAVSVGLRVVCWYMVAPIGALCLACEFWRDTRKGPA